jgi:hypothetical protein
MHKDASGVELEWFELTGRIVCLFAGQRSQEALEEIECSQALDAFQDGRHLGKYFFV